MLSEEIPVAIHLWRGNGRKSSNIIIPWWILVCQMPRYTTSQTYTDGNTQIVPLPDNQSSDLVVYNEAQATDARRDDEELEAKLRRISEQVPVRISNTSGSSAGSGSGDFHQVGVDFLTCLAVLLT